MKYLIVLYRSFLSYLLIAIAYRFMGKRELGELSVMDFIVTIFIADISVIAIENTNKSFFMSLLPISILVLLQIISSKVTLNNLGVRKIIDGKPSVIINRGKVNFKEMKKQRYNLDDLLMQLRQESIKSIEEVDYAILESTGKLSIFLKSDDTTNTYPLPLIIDGKVEEETLIQIKKNKEWLTEELTKVNTDVKSVFYSFYKDNNLYIIEQDKIK